MICPHCKIRLIVERIPDSGYGDVCVCEGCGHLIRCNNICNKLSFDKLPRDWFVNKIDLEIRNEIHEQQEQLHHDLGHWG